MFLKFLSGLTNLLSSSRGRDFPNTPTWNLKDDDESMGPHWDKKQINITQLILLDVHAFNIIINDV